MHCTFFAYAINHETLDDSIDKSEDGIGYDVDDYVGCINNNAKEKHVIMQQGLLSSVFSHSLNPSPSWFLRPIKFTGLSKSQEVCHGTVAEVI